MRESGRRPSAARRKQQGIRAEGGGLPLRITVRLLDGANSLGVESIALNPGPVKEMHPRFSILSQPLLNHFGAGLSR